MICPYCLDEVVFIAETLDRGTVSYTCPACGLLVPPLYVHDYRAYPPIVLNVVGFRAHGKTVFLSALYHTFKRFGLHRFWPRFSMLPINQNSLTGILEKIDALDAGLLPEPNQQIFPEPVMIHADGLPFVKRGKATLLIYDAAGESFEAPEDMIDYAHFVKKARTLFFLVSIPRIRRSGSSDVAAEMERLLSVYLHGMAGMNGLTSKQNLIVVFTAADELLPDLRPWGALYGYVQGKASPDTLCLSQSDSYLTHMQRISRCLEAFAQETFGAHQFLNIARERFASVQFSIVSSLGARPGADGLLPAGIEPSRILDPLLWLFEQAPSARRNRFLRQNPSAAHDHPCKDSA